MWLLAMVESVELPCSTHQQNMPGNTIAVALLHVQLRVLPRVHLGNLSNNTPPSLSLPPPLSLSRSLSISRARALSLAFSLSLSLSLTRALSRFLSFSLSFLPPRPGVFVLTHATLLIMLGT